MFASHKGPFFLSLSSLGPINVWALRWPDASFFFTLLSLSESSFLIPCFISNHWCPRAAGFPLDFSSLELFHMLRLPVSWHWHQPHKVLGDQVTSTLRIQLNAFKTTSFSAWIWVRIPLWKRENSSSALLPPPSCLPVLHFEHLWILSWAITQVVECLSSVENAQGSIPSTL